MNKLRWIVLVVVALLGVSCSSGDDNKDKIVAAVVTGLETESVGEDPVFEITGMECVAGAAYDEIGSEAFETAGAPESFDPTLLTAEDQETLAWSYVDCVDLGGVFSDIVSAEDMPQAIANCIEEQLEDDDVQVEMVKTSWIETEEEASVVALTAVFERCVG